MLSESDYVLAFSVFPGIGPVRFKALISYFGSAKNAWTASDNALADIGLSPKLYASFIQFRARFTIESYKHFLHNKHIRTLAICDPGYPKRLANITDAPIVLYVCGIAPFELLSYPKMLGIVGTRRITPYGREITQTLTSELVGCGWTIVSGMAYGVDSAAHTATLDLGGPTIAVLGCGVDIIAPASNEPLYNKLISRKNCLVISEMPPGHRPLKGLFPARNRIISGLSLGIVVTEGAGDSGALITARYAGDQGREVFAVPGPITSAYSQAANILIKNGATLVDSAKDIEEAFGYQSSGKEIQKTWYIPKNITEQCILNVLQEERLHIDIIVSRTKLPASDILSTLSILELTGIIKDYGEKIFGRVQ